MIAAPGVVIRKAASNAQIHMTEGTTIDTLNCNEYNETVNGR